MVYKGPSTGCRNCRDRHTKCDGARPGCKKCLTTGRICYGYRDVCGLFFKDVSKEVKDRQVRRANRQSSEKQQPSWQMTSIILPSTPSVNLQTASLSFFLQRYIDNQDYNGALSRGMFDTILPLYSAAKPYSALSLAVGVMSGWAMCLHLRPQRLRTSLISLEMNATKAIKQALEDPKQCEGDELLLAVLCLDFADHLASKAMRRPASGAHCQGALALVNRRGGASFESETSKSLLAAATNNTLQSALWFNDMKDRNAVLQLPEISGLSGQFVVIALQQNLVRVLKTTRILLGPPPDFSVVDPGEWQLAMLTRAQEQCNETRAWPTLTPAEWGFASPVLPASPSDSTATFPNLKAAFICGQWYCTYITALRIHYLALTKMTHITVSTMVSSATILAEARLVADAFCNFLRRFHATAAIMPHDSDPYSATLDRAASARLPLGGGEGRTFRGGVADAQHYLFSLLSWALLALSDEPHNQSGFLIDNHATAYVRAEYDAVSSALEAVGQRHAVFG